MPPPRRRPATPPTRRPKVAGLHRRADQPEQPDEQEATPTTLDVPVIGEESPNGHVAAPAEEQQPVEEPSVEEPSRRERRRAARLADPTPEPAPVPSSAEDEVWVEPEKVADAEDAVVEEEVESGKPEGPNLTIPIVLVVVALVLGGLGFFFMQQVSDARVGAGNDALSDPNSTQEVKGAADTAVASVLSYKFDDMPGATKRAKDFLAGEAVDQYDKSMKALETEIQNQKLQVAVRAVKTGVVSLRGDEARVLVFADQIGVRADNQPSGGPTQFAMDMRRVDGKWKIVKLDFFENPK